MKHHLKLAHTSKNGLKVFYINFDLKYPKIKTMNLREFFGLINSSLTSKDFKYWDIENINYHNKRINFKNHYKFFISKKHAERVLRKLKYLKQQKIKRGYVWQQ